MANKKNAIYMLVFFAFFLRTTQATCNIHFCSNLGEDRLRTNHQSCNLDHLSTSPGPATFPQSCQEHSHPSIAFGLGLRSTLDQALRTCDLRSGLGTWDLGPRTMASNRSAVYRKQSMYQEGKEEYKKKLLHKDGFQVLSLGAAGTSAC